jgi:hypothetical protein
MKKKILCGSSIITGKGDEYMKWVILSICILCLAGVTLGADQMVNRPESFIFLQEGSSGSFVNDGSGNYTLTMTDVVPYTVFFADRPARDTGFAPMDKFLNGFSFEVSNPPNAALILPDENETSDMVIVELTRPQYNNITRTLTYTAKQLKEYSFISEWYQDQKSKVDASIPERFGSVVLVIDGCPCNVVPETECAIGCRSQCWSWKEFSCNDCGGCCNHPWAENNCNH